MLDHNGRRYTFCSQPCKWIFEENIERFAGHLSIIDRLLAGQILPPTIPGTLAYMGLAPAECGDDATNYAWAFTQPGAPVTAN
jgi:toluene monooxygenase system protein A